MIKTNLKLKSFFAIMFLVLIFQNIEAASISFFETEKANYFLDEEISVLVKIENTENPINVVGGAIKYSPDFFEVKKVDISNSILTMWAEEISIDNEKGQISFVGGIENGFLGQEGDLFKIILKSKKVGQSKIDFADNFKFYLNDGFGTEINPYLKFLNLTIDSQKTKSTDLNLENVLISLALIVLLIVIILIRRKKNVKT